MSSRRRGEQGEQARGDDGQLLDAAEPERIREQAADGAQPHVAEYRAAVDGGGNPSKTSVSGSRNSPPAVSCQPAYATGPTPAGRPQRLVRIIPRAVAVTPPTAAMIPTMSSSAAGPSTTRATPPAPTAAAAAVRGRILSRSTSAPRPRMISGCTPATAAATPPGSRSAARNSSGKNAPMLRMPRASDFIHQPRGGRARPRARATSPAGSDRRRPASSG